MVPGMMLINPTPDHEAIAHVAVDVIENDHESKSKLLGIFTAEIESGKKFPKTARIEMTHSSFFIAIYRTQ